MAGECGLETNNNNKCEILIHVFKEKENTEKIREIKLSANIKHFVRVINDRKNCFKEQNNVGKG